MAIEGGAGSRRAKRGWETRRFRERMADNVAKAFEMCNSQQAEIAALRKQLAERDSELKALERVNAEQTEELKHLKEWIEHLNKNPD